MSPGRLDDCTGVLVAGGRGTRLGGVSKGLLRVGGATIAERSVALFRVLFADVIVVANEPAPYAELGVRVEADRIAGKGAPAGLHAGLSAARTAWIFTAGCDMPFLDEAAIVHLAAQRVEGCGAVAPTWSGTAQPLHAFWSRAALPTIDRMLREGDPSLQALLAAVGARLVPEAEWARIDPHGRSLENANTPEDLERLGLAPPPRPR